jgi:hypothetical protein
MSTQNTRGEFTTQKNAPISRMMNDYVKVRTRSLGMLRVCFGSSSMRLGVPFIAPRQVGAVGGQQGRPKLPSIGWRTGQPLFMSGARSPSYSGADDRCRFVAVGAPDSLVPPTDRWRGPRVARGLRDRPLRWRPLAHRTVRCTTGQSGEL